jgi:hypothetical protein
VLYVDLDAPQPSLPSMSTRCQLRYAPSSHSKKEPSVLILQIVGDSEEDRYDVESTACIAICARSRLR